MTFTVLCLAFVLWPIAALTGGQSFTLIVSLGAVATAATLSSRLKIRAYILILIAFFAFAGGSVLWSPKPAALVELDLATMKASVRSEVVRVGLMILAGGALLASAQTLDERGKRLLTWVTVFALVSQVAMVICLTLLEREAIAYFYPNRPDDEGVQNISRNCLIMAAAAPFLATSLVRGKRVRIGLAVAAVIVILEVAVLLKREVYAGLLAFAFAGIGWTIVRFAPRRGFQLIGCLIASAIVTAPAWTWAASRGANVASAFSTVDYRQIIWERTLTIVAQHPVAGAGVGALRTMRDKIETGVFEDQLVIPNHPHNMLIQLWAETGAIGAFLLATVVVMASLRLPSPEKLGTGAPNVAMTAGVMTAIGCVSFDLWNEWWWAVGALLAVLATLSTAGSTRSKA